MDSKGRECAGSRSAAGIFVYFKVKKIDFTVYSCGMQFFSKSRMQPYRPIAMMHRMKMDKMTQSSLNTWLP